MAKGVRIFLVGVACCVSSLAMADDNVLGGDAGLACEAILCLSSGVQPSECNPSLNRYFGIKHDDWSDTRRARERFLNKCPSASEPGMPARVSAIASGAGRCDAAYLNRTLKDEVRVRKCPSSRSGRRHDGDSNSGCRTVEITIIKDVKPAYCRVYDGHAWTYELGATYVGDKYDGGHWVDDAVLHGAR